MHLYGPAKLVTKAFDSSSQEMGVFITDIKKYINKLVVAMKLISQRMLQEMDRHILHTVLHYK